MHDQVIAAFGKVDILINSAGVTLKQPTLDCSEEEWLAIFDTNLTGTLRACQIFGASMIQCGYGRIINVASLSTFVAFRDVAAYGASKAAVGALTKSLAVEWAPYGVCVNAIAPGIFPTDMNGELVRSTERGVELLMRVPMGRFGEIDEIAGSAVFLSSCAASFITGEILVVDGRLHGLRSKPVAYAGLDGKRKETVAACMCVSCADCAGRRTADRLDLRRSSSHAALPPRDAHAGCDRDSACPPRCQAARSVRIRKRSPRAGRTRYACRTGGMARLRISARRPYWSHMNLNDHTAEEFEADILRNQATLTAQMGTKDWRWLRFPYLAEGDTPQKQAAVRAFLLQQHYRIAGVTMSFGDYAWNDPYAPLQARRKTHIPLHGWRAATCRRPRRASATIARFAEALQPRYSLCPC